MLRPFFFAYCLITGVTTPFLVPYLWGLGLNGRQVATVLAALPIMQLGAPLLWARLADRTRRHATVLRFIAAAALAAFAPLVLVHRFPAVLAAYGAFAFFFSGVSGIADALAVARARVDARLEYGRIRLWGSLGFLTGALLLGAALTARGNRLGDPCVPLAVVAALLATSLVAVRLRATTGADVGIEVGPPPHVRDVKELLRDPGTRRLLLVASLHWMGCAPYNAFFGLFARQQHMSPLGVALAFAVGVAAEVGVLFAFGGLRARASAHAWLRVAFAATVVRWLLVAAVHDTPALVALQLLHGLTFGLFWAAAVTGLQSRVRPSLRATAQALLVMAVSGVGNLVGYFATGALLDATGGVTAAFLAAAALELVPLLLVRPATPVTATKAIVRGDGGAPSLRGRPRKSGIP